MSTYIHSISDQGLRRGGDSTGATYLIAPCNVSSHRARDTSYFTLFPQQNDFIEDFRLLNTILWRTIYHSCVCGLLGLFLSVTTWHFFCWVNVQRWFPLRCRDTDIYSQLPWRTTAERYRGRACIDVSLSIHSQEKVTQAHCFPKLVKSIWHEREF